MPEIEPEQCQGCGTSIYPGQQICAECAELWEREQEMMGETTPTSEMTE